MTKQLVRKSYRHECPPCSPISNGKMARKRRGKKDMDRFHTYLEPVAKHATDGYQLATESKDVLDSLLHDVFDQIGSQASILLRMAKTKTLTEREIKASIKLMFPMGLYKYADKDATRALQQFHDSFVKRNARKGKCVC